MSVRISGPPPGGPRFDAARFAARATALLKAACPAATELSVALVSEATMAELNATHRGRASATDVLSFSLLEGEHEAYRGGLLGDVVIAVTVAARQARARGESLDDELLRLLIHGVLHLLGHDHEEEAEARCMRAREEELGARVGQVGKAAPPS